MTFLEKTQLTCLDAIEKGNLDICFKTIKGALKADSYRRNDFTQIQFNYNSLLKEEWKWAVTDYRRQTLLVAHSVRAFVQSLEDADVSEGVFIENLIIICNPDKRLEMETFFGKKYFPNAEFINYGDTFPKGIFDVIILEDENNIINQKDTIGEGESIPTALSIQRRKEMKQYLDATDINALYYGHRFDIKGYEQRVYFTNSRFSIYARLKELLEYTKYYGK